MNSSTAAPQLADPDAARKLSIQAGKKRAPQLGGLSGTESDSDSILSPDTAGPTTTSFSLAPLSAIAERLLGDGEESEEDEDDDEAGAGGWRTADKNNIVNAGDTVIKNGYLSKKGARRKTWKKRWFVLRPAHLAYYKTSAEYQLLRLLDLSEIHAITPVSLKRHVNTFGIVTQKRTFYLQAGNREDLDGWVAVLNETRQQLLSTASASSLPTPIHTPLAASVSLTKEALPAPPRFPPPHATDHHTGSSSESDDPGYSASPSTSKDPSKDSAAKPIISGYLMKCGSKRRNWRKRWFVLTGDKLIYSGSHMDKKPHRQIPLSTVLDALELTTSSHPRPSHHSTSQAPSSLSPPSGSATTEAEPATPGKSFTFKIITPKRTLLLCAPSEEEEIKWLSAVRALIARRAGTGTKDLAPLLMGGISASSSGGAGKAPSPLPVDALPAISGTGRRRGSHSDGKRVVSSSRMTDPTLSDKT